MKLGLLKREKAITTQKRESDTVVECQDWIKELLAERQLRRERSRCRAEVDPRIMVHRRMDDFDSFCDQ